MNFFTSTKISPRITRIRDIAGVFEYLVEGNERALLLDTGHGIGNIKEYVDKLTSKPYSVVLTHGHIDHANGAALFDEVYMNEKDLDLYKAHSNLQFRYEHAQSHKELKDISIDNYIPPRELPFLPLEDQQVFDLGAIHVKMIAAPGHTQGMMMALIEEERVILFGDGCGNQVLLFDEYASNVSEYLKTLKYIKTYEDYYDRIIRNHTSGESNKILLDNVIECCKIILSDTDAKTPTYFGDTKLFSAKELGKDRFPIDKSEGNIFYLETKRK